MLPRNRFARAWQAGLRLALRRLAKKFRTGVALAGVIRVDPMPCKRFVYLWPEKF
jgi:hypothetical protein